MLNLTEGMISFFSSMKVFLVVGHFVQIHGLGDGADCIPFRDPADGAGFWSGRCGGDPEVSCRSPVGDGASGALLGFCAGCISPAVPDGISCCFTAAIAAYCRGAGCVFPIMSQRHTVLFAAGSADPAPCAG